MAAKHEMPSASLSPERAACSQTQPLVSIFCFCRNAADTIRRCIDSILAQVYPKIEIIVQDGASNDGTLEILKSYGDAINLVSEPDEGPGDAMFRALNRVRGEIFGSCLADEALLPRAVSWAVHHLTLRPEAGAVYGDHYIMDLAGRTTGLVRPQNWDYRKVLCSEFLPPFCASFFRREKFLALGLRKYTGCGEFDLWLHLGAMFPIYYVSGLVSRYGVHPGELSFQVSNLEEQARGKILALEKLFSDPRLPSQYRHLRKEAIAGVHTWLVHCYCNCGAWSSAREYFDTANRIDGNRLRLRCVAERLLQYGIALFRKGRIDESMPFLELPLFARELFGDLDIERIAAIRAFKKP